MKLSEAAAIIEDALAYKAAPYTLINIRLLHHGLMAHVGMPIGDGAAEATITVSALDMEQARYPGALIRTLTWDAAKKLDRFLAGEEIA